MQGFKLNRAGMEGLLKSAGVAAMLSTHANRVASAARDIAPVDSGEYRDSIEVYSEMHPTRVAVHVGSTAPHGLIVEAKTGTLARALGSA